MTSSSAPLGIPSEIGGSLLPASLALPHPSKVAIYLVV